MKLVKPLIVVGAAVLMVTSVATAGAATRQQDRQQLKDATCTTAVAAKNGAQNGTKAQDRQKLQDGSCLTAVAYRSGSGNGTQTARGAGPPAAQGRQLPHDRGLPQRLPLRRHERHGTQTGTGAQDHQRLHDGTCLSA